MIRESFWLIVTTKEWKMRQTTGARKSPGEKIVKDIKRATRKQYSSEEKIRIVLDGLRGEDSIAELCRREGISQVARDITGAVVTKQARLMDDMNLVTSRRL